MMQVHEMERKAVKFMKSIYSAALALPPANTSSLCAPSFGASERAIGRGKHLVRHQGKTGAAKTLRRLASVVVIVERPFHPRHRAVEQRGVDHAASAGVMPRLQRTERADHAPLRGRPVVDRGPTEWRRTVQPARQRPHAPISLQQRIEARRYAQPPCATD